MFWPLGVCFVVENFHKKATRPFVAVLCQPSVWLRFPQQQMQYKASKVTTFAHFAYHPPPPPPPPPTLHIDKKISFYPPLNAPLFLPSYHLWFHCNLWDHLLSQHVWRVPFKWHCFAWRFKSTLLFSFFPAFKRFKFVVFFFFFFFLFSLWSG